MAFSDWRPGMLITAERLLGSTPQAPQSWDVQWTTSTGNNAPSFGNATLASEFTTFGRRCAGRLEITFGSTTNFGGGTGSDNWRFSAPVAAFDTAQIVGMGEVWQASASTDDLGKRLGCRLRLTTTTEFELEISTGQVDGAAVGGRGLCDAATPWTWAAGDRVNFDFQYPTAE